FAQNVVLSFVFLLIGYDPNCLPKRIDAFDDQSWVWKSFFAKRIPDTVSCERSVHFFSCEPSKQTIVHAMTRDVLVQILFSDRKGFPLFLDQPNASTNRLQTSSAPRTFGSISSIYHESFFPCPKKVR